MADNGLSLFIAISGRYIVIKESVHTLSCAFIALWMHLGSLESTRAYASLVLSNIKLPACNHNSIDARYACNNSKRNSVVGLE